MMYGTRVTLRAISPEDYPHLTRFKNNVEFELAGGGRPPRPATLSSVAATMEGYLQDKSIVSFGIEADEHLIGDCALFNREWVDATAELGIGIGDPAYWGRGYGREAIGLLLDYGFRLENIRRIWLEANATNERAIRCYRAVGFVEEGRLRQHVWSDGRYIDMVRMGLMRAEWKLQDR